MLKRHLPIALAAALFSSIICPAQVDTEITSSNDYELSIIQVFPSAFPEVDVLFQARNDEGQPLWNIKAEDLTIHENNEPCDLVCLKNISDQQVLDIALVVDHSGSMGWPVLEDTTLAYRWTQELEDSVMALPKPIDFAKEGLLSFMSSSDLIDDSLLVVGFGSIPDSIIGPTQNMDLLKERVNSMQAHGGTAFYDGLMVTLDKMEKGHQNCAIVALTDGQDNQSDNQLEDVVARAKELDIPIYSIGLGYVSDSTLKALSNETGGLFYKTEDPSQLESIYLSISRQLKSVYQVTYRSEISGSAMESNQLTFGFTNDTLTFSNPEAVLRLPEEVILHIHEKAEQEATKLYLGLTGGMVLLLGLTSFVLYRKKKRKAFRILSIHPNPFGDELTLKLSGAIPAAQFSVDFLSSSGQKLGQVQGHLNGDELRINAAFLPAGNCLIVVTNIDGKTASAKGQKQ